MGRPAVRSANRRVRVQGTVRRQRRRDRAGPQRRVGQPARRAAARAGHRPDHRADRADATRGDRGPGLRRSRDRPATPRPRGRSRRYPPQGQARQGPSRSRTRQSVPPSCEVADRLRGPGQQPQAAVRVGPHPDRLARGCPDLGGAGRLHQQPGQDRQLVLPGVHEMTTARSAGAPAPPVGSFVPSRSGCALSAFWWLVFALIDNWSPPTGGIIRTPMTRPRTRTGVVVPRILPIITTPAAREAAAELVKALVNALQAVRRAANLTLWLVVSMTPTI